MRLNEAYSKVHMNKNLPDAISIQTGLKQGDRLSSLPLNFASEYAIMKV
jgi:hypothetical protein